MNLLLFDTPFERRVLDAADPRAQHLRKVIRVQPGDRVFVGFVNGLRALAEVVDRSAAGGIELEIREVESVPPQLPVRLLIGLPRPHTAKRILFEAASLGVAGLHFFEAERGEPSYARSGLWHSDEWEERLRLGAEQGFTTHLPEVAMHSDLQSAITHLSGDGLNLVLDNYEASGSLADALKQHTASAVIALGPERGWSAGERTVFFKNGWSLVHLGPHVLRSETAAVAAVAAVASGLGLWRSPTQTKLG